MSVSNIKVVCRFRPENKLEEANNSYNIITVNEDNTSLNIDFNENDSNNFTFDKVFGWGSSQSDIFDFSIKSTVEDVLKGYNGTVFAYGQTGSGKTYTMMGTEDLTSDQRGIIPRIVESIFQHIAKSPDSIEYTVNVSYMEIYMERIKDLLNPSSDNLPIHEDKTRGIYVKGLLEIYVTSVEEVFQVMKTGALARAVAATNMNSESSRSHSIFVITISQKNLQDGGSIKMGKLSLVDLAGSEKVGKTGASGQTLEEAKKINKSLSSLGMVINALTDGKSTHIPYRDSKLTRILQESLGGNSRTTLIINCSPSSFNYSETMSTLRFGERAKRIQNKAKINQDLSPAELKAHLKKSKLKCLTYEQYIQILELELEIWRNGGVVSKDDYATMDKILASNGTVTSKQKAEQQAQAQAPAVTAPHHQHSDSYPPIQPPNRLLSPTNFHMGNHNGTDSIRSWTPTTVGDEDSIEYFMKDSILTDLLNEKETEVTELTKKLDEMTADNRFLRENELTLIKENKLLEQALTTQKVNQEKLSYQIQDLILQNDTYKSEQIRLQQELANPTSTSNNEDQFPTPSSNSLSSEKLTQMLNDLPSTQIAKNHERILKHTRSQLTFYELEHQNNSLKSNQVDELKNQLSELRSKEGEIIKENFILNEERNLLSKRCELLELKLKSAGEEVNKIITESNNADNTQVNLNNIKQKLEFDKITEEIQVKTEISQIKDNYIEKSLQVENSLNAVNDLQVENEKLRAKLTELDQKLINLTNLNNNKIESLQISMQNQLQEFETVKSTLASDLVTRCEKIIELELSLETALQSHDTEETDIKQVKISYQLKLNHLENQLQKVISVQRQLIGQNQTLKREVSILERKLDTRNDRIKSLEGLLEDAQDRTKMMTDRFEERIRSIREQHERSNMLHYGYNQQTIQNSLKPPSQVNQTHSSNNSVVSNSSSTHGSEVGSVQPGLISSRIAKPLRGGGKVGINNIIIGSGGNQSTLIGGSVVGKRPVKVRSASISSNNYQV